MPNRMLRDGILKSERLNSVSRDAELHYRRMMSVADDYGRMEASARILGANVWAMRKDVTEEQVEAWTLELTSGERPLVLSYEVHGRKYLQVQDFNQRIRERNGEKAKSLYPDPPIVVAAMRGQAPPVAAKSGAAPSCAASRSECLGSEIQVPRSQIVVRGSETERGTAAQSSDPIKSTATGASEPCEPPCDDRDKLAWSLASDLMENHRRFVPGQVSQARGAFERVLASAVNPVAVATSIREAHCAFCVWWTEERRNKPRCFIPSLVKWIVDEDYLGAPKAAVATATEGQPWKKIAAQIEGRRG